MRLKTWYVIHKWTSLVATVFLLLLCVTGLPLVFAHEIDRLLGRSVEAPAGVEIDARASVATIVADALARRPGDAVQFLVADAEEPDLWYVRLGTTPRSADMSAFYTYDARSGEYLHAYPLGQGFMDVMLRLHVDMYAGLPGTLFLGAMGLLLVVALVSGAVLYGPFMRRLPFGTVRRERTAQLMWLDLHNLLGIVTLVWLLVVGLTGAVNALSTPIFERWQRSELSTMLAQHPERAPITDVGAVDRALSRLEAEYPNERVSFMAFPGNEFAGPAQYVAFMQGAGALASNLLTPVLLDAHTGAVLARGEMPWYVTALLLAQPLHFGDYGGLPLKFLWALLDLVAIAVLASGLRLWWQARDVSFESWLARMGLDALA